MAIAAAPATPQSSVSLFESAPVRAAAISADGFRLHVVHPAAGRLVTFSLHDPHHPVRLETIDVGLEPTSVRLRSDDEAWVVNRLSDSISVVSLRTGSVIATIATADEPADLVFAGQPPCAFVSAAGAGLVQVFDPATRAEVARIPIFGEEPTALATDARGERVFVVVHRSGNGTTILPQRFAPPQPLPKNPALPEGPSVPRIVAADDPQYRDKHGVVLPDIDLVEIDAATRRARRTVSRIGTINFGLAVHPARDEVWVANTQAHNTLRFEDELRGRFVTNRVTRVDLSGAPRATPIDLNPGVDYDTLPNDRAKAEALAQPTDVVFSPDGTQLWVAAFGTDRVALLAENGGVLARVEVGDTPGTIAAPRAKRGPRSLVFHPHVSLLYAVAQLSNSVIVVDTSVKKRVAEVSLGLDPTPLAQRQGRGFLYDAKLSGNGLVSCASCHVDGRRDGLAWDLGDPWGELRVLTRQREPFVTFELHPMKGPLLTQTLLGLAGEEAFHWRGDRADLGEFNATFRTLLGGKELGAEDLGLFLGFLGSLRFPPNPNQNSDRTYTDLPKGESARDGFEFFKTANFSGVQDGPTCTSCHTRPSGSSDEIVIGRESAQYMLTPHLRDLYQRTGRRPEGGRSRSGFGLLHAGHENGVFEFLSSDLLFLGKLRGEDRNKRMLERFLMEFDTGTAPAVGRSLTVSRHDAGSRRVAAELDLLVAQAKAGSCGLVAHEHGDEGRRSWAWDVVAGRFLADRSADASRTRAEMLDAARRGASVTFLGTPPGEERLYSIDRDGDDVRDGDEWPVAFGAASPRCAPPLSLAANDTPRLGRSDFALVCEGAPRASAGVLLLSGAAASTRLCDLVLHVDLRGLVLQAVASDRRGVAAAAVAIPDDPALVGTSVWAQAVFPHRCGRLGLAASNGLRLTVRR